ncbi:hypothetical protein ACQ4PT_011061 [Festuca glaucescens]
MAGPYASPGLSDHPIDLLIRIIDLLELPEALTFRAVCPSWRSASREATTSVPPHSTPWLVSLAAEPLPGSKRSCNLWDPAAASELRSLLDAERTFKVSFPRGRVVALYGASHGWLIMANMLSDLVLYDPFTSALVPLPPIIGFDLCVEGVYGDDDDRKTLVGYRYGHCKGGNVSHLHKVGGYFYDKVVLSGSPSAGGAVVSLAFHLDGKRLSFASVGDVGSKFQGYEEKMIALPIVSVTAEGSTVVTMKGRLKCVEFGGPGELWIETVIAEDDDDIDDVITRYLISTPWGRLLQARVILDKYQVNNVRVEIDRLDMKSQKMVGLSSAKALRGHSAFVGQNTPGLLSSKEFPELKPDCIYFTTPRRADYNLFDKHHNEWKGVKVYDLKKRTLEAAFPPGGGDYGTLFPSEVWFTPSLRWLSNPAVTSQFETPPLAICSINADLLQLSHALFAASGRQGRDRGLPVAVDVRRLPSGREEGRRNQTAHHACCNGSTRRRRCCSMRRWSSPETSAGEDEADEGDASPAFVLEGEEGEPVVVGETVASRAEDADAELDIEVGEACARESAGEDEGAAAPASGGAAWGK